MECEQTLRALFEIAITPLRDEVVRPRVRRLESTEMDSELPICAGTPMERDPSGSHATAPRLLILLAALHLTVRAMTVQGARLEVERLGQRCHRVRF
jgi:hypothetical protein